MKNGNLSTQSNTAWQPTSKRGLPSLLMVLFILVFVALPMWQTRPTSPAPANTPSDQFSSQRAMQYLNVIAAKPHMAGSQAQHDVTQYLYDQIKALGLEPEIQKGTAVNQTPELKFDKVTDVQNVMVRLKGKGDGHDAILLTAHYDTMINATGASDDGAGVASLLETLRILKQGPPLKNDVIVLFTDAEEIGLFGAKAFAEQHPWAKDVKAMFNFGSRGTSGPVLLFQTTDQNGWMIDQLAKAIPSPFANSFLYAALRLIPNETDFTEFQQDTNASGLNFIFAKNSEQYQNSADNLSTLDQGSLQQEGTYALAVAKQFGNSDLQNTRAQDQVFFNIGGMMLLHYSTAWVIPTLVVVLLLFVAVLWIGLRNKQVTVWGIVKGFLIFLLMILAAVLLATGISMLINPSVTANAYLDNKDLYFVGFLGLTVAVTSALYVLFQKKTGMLNMSFGALIWWLILTVVMSLLLPSGSYLFAIPLLFGLLLQLYLLRAGAGSFGRTASIVWLCLLVLPALLLLGQMIYMGYVMIEFLAAGVWVLFTVLLVGMLFPHLHLLMTQRKWVVSLATTALGVIFVLWAALTPVFHKDSPKLDSLLYGYNITEGKAVWATFDSRYDDYVGQYINKNNVLSKNVNGFFTDWEEEDPPMITQSKAPIFLPDAKGTTMQVVEDKTSGDTRLLHLKMTPSESKNLWQIVMSLSSNKPLTELMIEGKVVKNRDEKPNHWELKHFGDIPAGGIDIVFHLQAGQTLKFRTCEMQTGLDPSLKVRSPKEYQPGTFGDLTMISRTYQYESS